MIDIHSHLLPFVDDGSDSVEKSIELLRQAYNQGVTDMILTPHFRDEFVEDEQSLKERFQQFKQEVVESGVNVNLYLGREIHVRNDYKRALQEFKPESLNDTKYLLIEFDFDAESDIVNIVYELARRGFIPIVAHLERYGYADEEMAFDIKQSGGLIQINAQALIKAEARAQKKFLNKMLAENLVDFVASDMHMNRQYLMKKAYKKVAKKYGKNTANAIFYQNAQKIIQGQP